MKSKIFERIRELLVDKYYVPYDDVKIDTVYEHLDIDSLTLLEIFVILDKEYKLTSSNSNISDEITIGQSIDNLLAGN
ncbi:acyl carrier protein [Vibrio gazogenes]|uniref:Phosphopantetheine attachment site n=1 Tax=Vibrio gazogenes DSM 21264 = NBRC 103151 TaxID=1123492 RepID=A0A1M5CKN5_VIBGA|nr:phosphopantetheine-binding protein [Vibrio gazogenes]USP14219.1 phosphopantetheine-binding protein [Vibrio gazogenes]SHF55270.1 Phosphopantetheine attachment site [Vibrio gazogenes DSM 21264] [Vibrio gazogenes DSM 21264 = NBRC 103151]SJN53720.1 acyl carrier protein [Vibrio gazogenes]